MNSEELEQERLEAKYPGWMFWFVKLYPAGYEWCAASPGHSTATHHAYSPEDLDSDVAAWRAEKAPGGVSGESGSGW